jgi:hypothetical protein
MARDIDEKKKRKALRKLRKAAERAEAENGPGLSDWEREFVDEVEMRVEKYGSAFADPEKGNLDEPLSALQARKLKEIDKKSRGKASGFKARSGFSKAKKKQSFTPRSRDINDDIETVADHAEAAPPSPEKPRRLRLVAETQAPPPTPEASAKPPEQPHPFRVITGGKDT